MEPRVSKAHVAGFPPALLHWRSFIQAPKLGIGLYLFFYLLFIGEAALVDLTDARILSVYNPFFFFNACSSWSS